MRRVDSLNLPEKLLVSAYHIEQNGKTTFSYENLVVSAWQHFPDAFGLNGYRGNDGKLLYPDSEKVHKKIISSTSIRKHGYLRKVGKRMYQLTETGREQARLLLQSDSSKTHVEKIALSREIISALKKLFSSKVIEKFKNDQLEEISFSDACTFWGISPRSSAAELRGEISNLEQIVEIAKKSAKDKMVSFEHSGDAFGESDLEILLEAHRQLLQKFKNELMIIQQRTDERV